MLNFFAFVYLNLWIGYFDITAVTIRTKSVDWVFGVFEIFFILMKWKLARPPRWYTITKLTFLITTIWILNYFLHITITVIASPCRQKRFISGIVCVCTEDYCDTLENVDPINDNDIVLVSTSLVITEIFQLKSNITSTYSTLNFC